MNPFPLPAFPEEGDDVSAAWARDLVDAIAAGRLLDVDGIEAEWTPDGVLLRAWQDETQRTYYTTGTIAAASDTGTTVSTAVLAQGSGTARICRRVPSTAKYAPDTVAQDDTIYNDVEASIAAGIFVKCALKDGVWVIDLKNKC